MRLLRIAAAAGLAALVLPALAVAKGPTAASMSGPGLAGPIAIGGQGEPGMNTPLGRLVDAGGFFPQVFGQSPDPTLRARPAGDLGPAYTVVYVVPGPNTRHRLTQLVYPYATPTAVTYMRAGQVVWPGQTTNGGWFRAPSELKPLLVRAGLPATPPAPPGSGGFWWSPGSYAAVGAAALLALALLAWAAFALRRRERPVAAH